MSFLKELFGASSSSESGSDNTAKPAGEAEHRGFIIKATPFKEGGQLQLCGVISKNYNGTVKEHRFVRADRFASMEDVVAITLMKGRQIIDEQGDKLFQ